MTSAPLRIDVHHHYAPPAYLVELEKSGHPVHHVMKKWAVAHSLEDMEKAAIATSMMSITTPGVWFGNKIFARRLARLCNDHGARLAQAHPGRFGIFACLPVPDIEGALQEIEYALDQLKANGVGLYTSYDNVYLGNAKFAPLFGELNRRRAVVYTHPVIAPCCVGLIPDVNESIIEYGTETTRTIASLLFGSGVARYPDIKFIWPMQEAPCPS